MNSQTTSDWEIELQHRRARLLNHLLLAAVIGGALAMIPIYVDVIDKDAMEKVVTMAPFVGSWLIVAVAWLWRGLPHSTRAGVLLTIAYVIGFVVFARGGLAGSGRTWLLLLPIMAFVLMNPRFGLAVGGLSILTYAFFIAAFNLGWVDQPQVSENLTAPSAMINEGSSFVLVTVLIALILRAFSQSWTNAMRESGVANVRVQARSQELENTTKVLHRQTSQLRATAEVARAGSAILDPEKLSSEVTNRIQEEFSPMGVYYVGLFLLDEAGESAVLKAATGEAGQQLLEMEHRLALDQASAISWCINHQEPLIALGAEGETVRFHNPALSRTRSEIALPLRSRGHILGALSVQSVKEAAFEESDIAVLQTMADLVALSIDNARLFSKTEDALQEVQAAHQLYLAEAWREFLARRPVAQVDYVQPGVESRDEELLASARRAAMLHRRTVAIDTPASGEESSAPQSALVIPLELRGQVIGTIALHETRRQKLWNAEDIALAETVAEQVGLTIENMRLMDQTQRRVVTERIVRDISDRMQRAPDLETLMRVTAEELNRLLGGSHIYVRMGAGDGHTDEGDSIDAKDAC